LSAGSHMLLLLGLCLWLPVCLCVLSVVVRAEVDAGKFVHGLYITFGSDTKRLRALLCLQFFSLCIVLTLPSWLLTGLVATLAYALAGFTCYWHFGCLWLLLLVMPLLTWLSIGLQASHLVRQQPVKLLAASNVADIVSSPRKSADVTGTNQPLRLALLGLFRMRRYYLPLILICSLCASSALGLFAVGRGTANGADAVAAFTLTADDGFSPQVQTDVLSQISAVAGVANAAVNDTEKAADVGTHLLLLPGQTDGGVTAGTYELFGDVTLRIANEVTNEALDFTYSPKKEGEVTLLLPTSGPTVSLDLAVGDTIIVRGRQENGDAGATLLQLTISFIRRGAFDGMTLLLHPNDYAALAAQDAVSFYESAPLPTSLQAQDGIVLALPADEISDFAVGETVTLHRVNYSERKTYDGGKLSKYVKSAEELLHGSAADNGLLGADSIETTVSAIVAADGDTGYLLYNPASALFADFGTLPTGVTGIMELKTVNGTLCALHTDAFAVALDGDVCAEQSLSLPSYPDADEVSKARGLAAQYPKNYENVNLDTPNDEYNHIQFYVTDTFSYDGKTVAVGFRRRTGNDTKTNPFTPILTYGQAYVMPTGDNALVPNAELLLKDDQIKSYKTKTTSPFGNLSADNNWLLTADDTVAPGTAVLELPRGCDWQIAVGDVLHTARGQDVNLRRYVEDTAMLTDPTVLLETQLQYVSYLYDNFTVTAVTQGAADVPVVRVCGEDAAKICGRSYFAATVDVCVDRSISSKHLAALADVLAAFVLADTDEDGNTAYAYTMQNDVWNDKVWSCSGFSCGTLCHGILVLCLLPLTWLFTQNGHYKKRKKDLDLLFGIGKSDAEIAALLRSEAGVCGALTAVGTALFAYPVCLLFEKLLSLPDVPLSAVRIGFLPYVAVVLTAGFAAAVVTYISARRVCPTVQKGGVGHGHS